ncbi:MAG: Appr-1-p processing protein [Desulfovibrio sp. MES5]|uniref:type II toxin-antitoxin system antitoxin DNA ADP-ribosyl glycohydrolase DarG n=1 Tax=Desulfovibrionaceae TaxID=194924 RepID=UPI000B9CFA1E|nr:MULTISPECIES: macro domain-containing protein [Desulfovibrionaceae]OXS28076.1 MAG: Appr-1-p processing protein [Desulfovibrio sp. MES5]
MIEYKSGDILKEEADAIVNTVNCVGVMGRGIALQFKKTFPANYKAYEAACENKAVVPGSMFVYATGTLTAPRFIINFPTKRHWRGKSSLNDIEAGLDDLVRVIQERGITSIAIPPLGCGLGGLDWPTVRTAIEQRLSGLANVRIILFEPNGAPKSEEMAHAPKAPNMTPGRAALVSLMDRYLRGLLDPFVTLLEVHKLMYFMQTAGETLNLKYKKATFGPYAENLRHALHAIEGFYVTGYADGGDAPDKPLSIVPGAEKDAATMLAQHPETQARLERVFQLVEGFESSFGLELLASVHWVATNEAPKSLEALTQSLYAWNPRKKKFSERQIALAAGVLQAQGWLEGWSKPAAHA